MPGKSRDELISEIVEIYRELRTYTVFSKEINLGRASDEDLEAELEMVGDQLKQRKKWLGVDEEVYEQTNY